MLHTSIHVQKGKHLGSHSFSPLLCFWVLQKNNQPDKEIHHPWPSVTFGLKNSLIEYKQGIFILKAPNSVVTHFLKIVRF